MLFVGCEKVSWLRIHTSNLIIPVARLSRRVDSIHSMLSDKGTFITRTWYELLVLQALCEKFSTGNYGIF